MTQIGSYKTKSEPLEFDIDGHECFAAGALPVETFIEFIGVLGQLGTKTDDADRVGMDAMAETVRLLSKAVRLCCLPDTVDYITTGLASNEHPIDLEMLQTILQDIMEAYGMSAKTDDDESGDSEGNGGGVDDESARPTQGTSDSSTGSETTEDGSEAD